MEEISIDYIKSVLEYDSESGKLYWKKRKDVSSNWNTKYAGKEAFTASNKKGYKHGSINKKHFSAHRVAWMIYYHEIPDIIDHINGDIKDNRIINLRSCSIRDNTRNGSSRKNATSKYLGVNWKRSHKKWEAWIKNEKNEFLGYFSSEKDAAIAYNKKAKEYFGEFARLNVVY